MEAGIKVRAAFSGGSGLSLQRERKEHILGGRNSGSKVDNKGPHKQKHTLVKGR